jgi:hypothetical protein
MGLVLRKHPGHFSAAFYGSQANKQERLQLILSNEGPLRERQQPNDDAQPTHNRKIPFPPMRTPGTSASLRSLCSFQLPR